MKGKATKYGCKKRVKGGLRPFSSAPCGSRGGAPLWGLGQRPNCFSCAQLKGNSQQRRRQRSVPASNFALPQKRPPSCFPQRAAHCRVKWARPTCCSARYSSSFPQAGISPLRRRQGGNENRRMSAGAANINSGVSGAFSPNTPPFYASFSTVIFPSVTFSRTRSPSAILPPSSSSLSVSSTVR